MKNKQLFAFGLMLAIPLLSFSATFPTQESGNYSQYCKEEWTKRGKLDRDMYDYCVQQEQDGYAEAQILIKKYDQQPWIQAAIDFSVGEWTMKGARQDQMVNYTLSQITDGWEDLIYASKQSNFDKSKYQSCSTKWGARFDLVNFCYKN